MRLFKGRQGKKGERGVRGVEGMQGKQGVPGVNGVRGLPGKIATKRYKILSSIVSAILVLLLGILGVFVFWMTYPYEPTVFQEEPFKVETKVVKQGGALIFGGELCKNYSVRPVISRAFTNGLVFYTPLVVGEKSIGCQDARVAVRIPQELPVGVYFLKNTYQYRVNPIRIIRLVHNTEEFEVIE